VLIDPEGALALLREQRQQDLAIVAIVGSMQDGYPEAIGRLDEIAEAFREWRGGLDRHKDRIGYETATRALAIIPRIRDLLRQVEERGWA